MKSFQSKIVQPDLKIEGSVQAKCASNIALIKYWGKRDIQIPMNPSLSFTLTNCYTETQLKFKPKNSEEFQVEVYLDKNLNEQFVPRIITFFERIEPYFPYVRNFQFEIHTRNTFPHSSGIASSASGMGALALCLLELEEKLGGELTESEKLKKASFFARLGSGSACRSVYQGITIWGETEYVDGSSDLYGVPYPYEIHEVFQNFQDTILLIDEGQKEVSSSVGHQLMENHPYAKQRFRSANDNLKRMIPVLKNGDLDEFGKIVEHEALSLHAMMMTSNPSYILMKPQTLAVIDKIWEFRKLTSTPLFFTLDAGANVHLLYSLSYKKSVDDFIERELILFCRDGKKVKDWTI